MRLHGESDRQTPLPTCRPGGGGGGGGGSGGGGLDIDTLNAYRVHVQPDAARPRMHRSCMTV